MLDQEQKAKIIELRAAGKSYASIAKELHIAKQTAVDFCKENEERIATLKAMELESLYEAHALTKEARLTAIASLKDKLQAEIDRRDLTDVPTEKLISLYLNTQETLRDEAITPHFQSTAEQNRDKSERELLDRLTR